MSPVDTLEGRRRAPSAEALPSLPWALGSVGHAVERRLAAWRDANVAPRFWRKDPALWPAATADDVRSRMGWLEVPEAMSARVAALVDFADEVRREGFRHVVVLGMGGSSLAPDVFAHTYEAPEGYPELFVLDSTHPAAVTELARRLDLVRTLFLVSSKSGTTTEPDAFFRYFFDLLRTLTDRPGRQFVAITDPGTPLEALAREHGFRRVFTAPPDVGGRYSALTVFGLVPAALHGVRIAALLDRALHQVAAEALSVPVPANPGFLLGAALGELAQAGRDKVTFLADPPFEAFPDWVEQLIAESTGKTGKGIVPVVGEPVAPTESYGTDRVFVTLESPTLPDGVRARGEELARAGHPVIRFSLSDPGQLGAEFFRWESAVAMTGAVLGIDPYDQPDVELAKQLARDAMADPNGPGRPPEEMTVRADLPTELARAVATWAEGAGPRDYLAVQAYLAPFVAVTADLQRVRHALLVRYHRATTLGYGPRFLHSTGQLHKGGPPEGRFLQLTSEVSTDVPVPGTSYSFGRLIEAQALGDLEALVQRGRTVLRVELGRDVAGGLSRLAESLHG